MARGRKTGGRVKGTPNRATRLKREAMAAASVTPMEFLLGVMRSDVADPKMRLEAAKAAAGVIYPRPKEGAPGDNARLLEGSISHDWSEADAVRLKTLRSQCWAALSPQEQAECRDLDARRFQVEQQRRYATMTAAEIEAEERDQGEVLEPRSLRRRRVRARWCWWIGQAATSTPRGGRKLIYAGRVGTGWDHRTARAIRRALEPLARSTSPLTTPIKKKDTIWIEPRFDA